MLYIVKLNTTQTNPEMSKTVKTKKLMLAFRNEETFQLALKGYYTHHQSSILKCKLAQGTAITQTSTMNIKAVKEAFVSPVEKLFLLKATIIFMELNTLPNWSRVNPKYNKVATNLL